MESYSLRKYLATNSLPSRVKVTEGNRDPVDEKLDFPTGDVLDLHKIVCPTVEINYYDQDSGAQGHMSVSVQCPCLFKILPYIPDVPMYLDKPNFVKGVKELVRIWPSIVSIEQKYFDPQKNVSLKKGEKLKLRRLVSTHRGEQSLECRIMTKAQLVRLPMDCTIKFQLLADNTAYNLSEITEMPGRVRRRLRLSDDMVNKTIAVPGLELGFSGDLFMEPPTRFVEVSPTDSPGLRSMIPENFDISVAPRDDDYTSDSSFIWYPLDSFVETNKSKLPMVVQVVEWSEEPLLLQAIRVSVRDRLVLHHLTTVPKLACQYEDQHFSIPISFDGHFRVKKRTFNGIEEICRVRNTVRKVKVLSGVKSNDPDFSGVAKGDVLDIGPTRVERIRKEGAFYDEIEILKVYKNGSSRPTLLPLFFEGVYEEIISFPGNPSKKISTQDIDSDWLPLNVEMIEGSTKFSPRNNPLPLNETITIKFMYQDDCVVASKDANRMMSCPLPLHTGIQVRYLSKYPRSNPVPETSGMEVCPQEISLANVQQKQEESAYECPEDPLVQRAPSLPPRPPGQTSFGTLPSRSRQTPLPHNPHLKAATIGDANPPPIPDRQMLKGSVQRSVSSPSEGIKQSKGLKGFFKKQKGQVAAGPRRPPPPEPEDADEDDMEYEDVTSVPNYEAIMVEIFGKSRPPTITIPSDANIHTFTWQQMVVFLQLNYMPPPSIRHFAENKIDGEDFANMTDSELSKIGINQPLIRRFRNQSRSIDDSEAYAD